MPENILVVEYEPRYTDRVGRLWQASRSCRRSPRTAKRRSAPRRRRAETDRSLVGRPEDQHRRADPRHPRPGSRCKRRRSSSPSPAIAARARRADARASAPRTSFPSRTPRSSFSARSSRCSASRRVAAGRRRSTGNSPSALPPCRTAATASSPRTKSSATSWTMTAPSTGARKTMKPEGRSRQDAGGHPRRGDATAEDAETRRRRRPRPKPPPAAARAASSRSAAAAEAGPSSPALDKLLQDTLSGLEKNARARHVARNAPTPPSSRRLPRRRPPRRVRLLRRSRRLRQPKPFALRSRRRKMPVSQPVFPAAVLRRLPKKKSRRTASSSASTSCSRRSPPAGWPRCGRRGCAASKDFRRSSRSRRSCRTSPTTRTSSRCSSMKRSWPRSSTTTTSSTSTTSARSRARTTSPWSTSTGTT